jgi:hypothetical protein
MLARIRSLFGLEKKSLGYPEPWLSELFDASPSHRTWKKFGDPGWSTLGERLQRLRLSNSPNGSH